MWRIGRNRKRNNRKKIGNDKRVVMYQMKKKYENYRISLIH